MLIPEQDIKERTVRQKKQKKEGRLHREEMNFFFGGDKWQQHKERGRGKKMREGER